MKSKTKDHVIIGPHSYDIVFDKEACVTAEVTGAFLHDSQKIILDPTCSEGIQRESLLHESLHGLWQTAALDLDVSDSGPDSEGEKMIRRLSPILLDYLRKNPDIIRYLQEED